MGTGTLLKRSPRSKDLARLDLVGVRYRPLGARSSAGLLAVAGRRLRALPGRRDAL